MAAPDYKRVFDLYDLNKDGTITTSELKGVMISFGYHASDQELRDILTELDTNHNGVIDYNEFITLLQSHPAKTGEEMRAEDIVEAFRAFDRDGNGLITADELKATMAAMGQGISDEEVQEMIQEADLNHDGKINYEEFARMMLKE